MTCKELHKNLVAKLHKVLLFCLQKTALVAARKPRLVLSFMSVSSVLLILIGFLSNFYVETDEVDLWTPYHSKALQNGQWLRDQSGFDLEPPSIQVIIHDAGENMIGRNSVDYSFQVMDVVEEAIKDYDFLSYTIHGVVNFFNNNHTLFLSTVKSDEDAIHAMSVLPFFPNGMVIDRNKVFGFPIQDHSDLLISAQSYMMEIDLHNTGDGNDFENLVVKELLSLKRQWSMKHAPYSLEVLSSSSYGSEVQQSLDRDKVLIPLVFLVMCFFSFLAYYKRDRVRSSSLYLGLGAPVTVIFSLLTSFGVMFIVGVPFSNLTFMLPFIIMGVGLDDAFIITGSYFKTGTATSFVDRISNTMKDCSISIFVTTLTTSLAFCLSLFSEIPAIYNFSAYAIISVWVDFLYQITFFIAIMKLNEERIQNQRYDLFPCCIRQSSNQLCDGNTGVDTVNEMVMKRFAQTITVLSRKQRLLVVLGFFIFSGIGTYSTMKLKVSFDVADMVRADSYIKSFTNAFYEYYQSGPYNCIVIFRGLDFSAKGTQHDMRQYLESLMELNVVDGDRSGRFWLDDFDNFILDRSIGSMSFTEQIDLFLQDELYSKLYLDMIVKTNDGQIASSAVSLILDIDRHDTQEKIDFLSSQENITRNQAVNQSGQTNFFAFSPKFYMWEFFRVSVHELIFSTIIGLVAVFFTTLIFVQDLSACLFVTSTVTMIYVDVLGIAQFSGLSINPVTYVSVILSIGLIVDYIVHIMFRYCESTGCTREERVLDSLSTMGSAIILGAMSTVLGVIPLAFTSSEIFLSVLIIFLSFVLLSLAHGLVYLPLLLSLIGPGAENIQSYQHDLTSESDVIPRRRKGTDQTSDLSVR